MIEILLLVIACCLLFGSERTKHGIGVVLKIIGVGILVLCALLFLGVLSNNVEEEIATTQQESEYVEVNVEELAEALSGSYDQAKEKYDGMNVTITGKLGTPHEEFGIDVMPNITSEEPSTSDGQTWIPCLANDDKTQQDIVAAGTDSIVTLKGALWVANYEDAGIELEEGDDPNEFAITLLVESVE